MVEDEMRENLKNQFKEAEMKKEVEIVKDIRKKMRRTHGGSTMEKRDRE